MWPPESCRRHDGIVDVEVIFGLPWVLKSPTSRDLHVITELPGAMPGPAQCPLTNTKTVAQFEAIEPRTIATIAIFSSVRF
jgi:hypothetical protein